MTCSTVSRRVVLFLCAEILIAEAQTRDTSKEAVNGSEYLGGEANHKG